LVINTWWPVRLADDLPPL